MHLLFIGISVLKMKADKTAVEQLVIFTIVVCGPSSISMCMVSSSQVVGV